MKKNGEKVNVLHEILYSQFAVEDERSFHQLLSNKNPNAQLNYYTTQQIMFKIEEAYSTRDIPKKTWLSILRNQASVHYEQNQLETALMARQLGGHNGSKLDMLLQKKENAFKLCKEVDEVSVGRACGTRNTPTSSVVSGAYRKLQWLKSQSIGNQSRYTHKPVDDSGNLPNLASSHAANKKPNSNNSDMKTNNGVEDNNNGASPKTIDQQEDIKIRKGNFLF